jgi:hypothetical protein
MNIDGFKRAGLSSEVCAHDLRANVDGELLKHRDAGD